MTDAQESRLLAATIGAHAEVVAANGALIEAAERRKLLVRQLHEAGWSYGRIAEMLDLSRSAVAGICS